jgi:hypothetical protein
VPRDRKDGTIGTRSYIAVPRRMHYSNSTGASGISAASERVEVSRALARNRTDIRTSLLKRGAR